MRKHFDFNAFYTALDAQREAKNMSWRDVANETGVNASTLTRLGQGKSPDVENFLALIDWLGIDAKTFWDMKEQGKPETLAIISTALRNDPYLDDKGATLIDELVRNAYKNLCKQ